MKKYFKISTALAFLFAVNLAPTFIPNTYALESTDNEAVVEEAINQNETSNEIVYDNSIITEEPIEVEEPAYVESTADANNISETDQPRAPALNEANWDTDKSKDASDLNEAGETEITISLPSGEVQNTAEVVFVLDKSTYSDYPSTIENSLNLLSDLKESGASVKVAIVHFNRTGHPSEWFDVQTQYDEIVAALKVKYSHGSNMHAGLLAAQELLENSTDIADENKFVVLISDGSVYLHCKNGDYTVPYSRAYDRPGSRIKEDYPSYGGYWAESMYNPSNLPGNVKRPKVPDADKWEEYFADVEARNNESNGDQYDFKWLYYDGTKEEIEEGYIKTPSEPRTASNIDIAYLHCNEVWKKFQSKYHTYAIGVKDNGAGEGNWDDAKAFMRYLNNNQEPNFDQLKKDLILLSKGSKVIDYVGNDFDFVNDKERIVVKIGDQVLEAEEISANNYGFGKNEDGTYRYTVEYVPGEEEHLVWNINEDVNNYTHTKLVFFEKLNNIVYKEGTHTVPTNEQGILYPINSEGIAGEPEEFEIPTVDYHIGKVIIHYEDLDNNVLRDNDELTGLVGEDYETESTKATRHQEILDRGYKYWRSTGKVEGKFLDERPINVTYLYEKLGQLIVKYLDADDNTNVLATEVNKYGTVGDEYYTIDAEPADYILSSISGEPYGKYTEDSKENPIVVIYYYTKPTTNVITHYVDADDHSKELTEADTKPGKVGEAYTTTARTDIENYTLVGNSGNVEGAFDKEDINVYYYYKRDEGTVTAYYVDRNTMQVITEKTTPGYVPDAYETAPITIDGYRYTNIVVGEETGTYAKDENIKVYYYYDPVGKVIVKYLEEGTNKVLADEEVLVDPIGSVYTTYDYYKENIDNYNWVRTEGNERGRYTTDDQEVIYYYQIPAVTGELVVNYIDQDNNLLDSWSNTEEVGTEYTTEEKSFDGYTPKYVIGATSGTYSAGTTTVTYVYAKNQATPTGEVVVKYIENTGRKLVDEDIVISGEYGTSYTTEQKSFDGYNFVAVYGPTQGSIDQPKTTVIYMYEKVKSDETGTGSCSNNCCNCCSSCNNSCNNGGEGESTQPVINIDITINNDNSTEVNNENNNQDENNNNIENNPVNNADVNVETGDTNVSTGDTNVNVSTGDTNVTTGDNNIENNTNVETGDNNNTTNIENNPTIETGDVTNNNTAEGGNSSNTNTNTDGDVTVNTGDVTQETGDNNNTNNNQNDNNTCTDCNNPSEEPGDEPSNPDQDSTPTGAVVAYYRSVDGDILAENYYDEKGIDSIYVTPEKPIEGYEFVRTEGAQPTGTITDGLTKVYYYYKKKESTPQPGPDNPPVTKNGEVVAHYVDIYGNMIGVNKYYEGEVGKQYETQIRYFSGYRLVQIVGARTGEFTNGKTEVTYIYEKNPTGSTTGEDPIITPTREIIKYLPSETGSTAGSSKYSAISIPNTGVSENTIPYGIILLISSIFSIIILKRNA